jgi:hypothetical protein
MTLEERLSGDESSLTSESESEMCHEDMPMRQRPVKSPVLHLGFSSSYELEAGEVEVIEGSTCSGHHLLELLLLFLVPVAVLLVIALAVIVPLGVVVLVGGGVKLLPLGAVGDEVGGVAALKAAPRRSPPLLEKPMQGSELSHQQGDLVIRDALVLLIRSYTQGRQSKL